MTRLRLGHRIVSTVVIGLFVFGGGRFVTQAEPREDDVSKRLIGTWRLVSIEGTDPTIHTRIDRPTGLIIYDRSGWMAAQIAWQGDRKPFVNGVTSGTLEEKAAAFDSHASYYGTYTLDLKAQTVTHRIEDHSYPGAHGHNNVRWFEFQGNDRLLLIPCEDGRGGVIDRKSATYKLLWERVR